MFVWFLCFLVFKLCSLCLSLVSVFFSLLSCFLFGFHGVMLLVFVDVLSASGTLVFLGLIFS